MKCSERTHLHGSTVSDGLIGVHTTVGLLAVEVVLQEFLHLRDAGGAANKHNLVQIGLLQAGVSQHVLHGVKRLAEEVDVQLLETGASKWLGEINAIVQGLDLNTGLVAVNIRQSYTQ
jgi:hypothetical protein